MPRGAFDALSLYSKGEGRVRVLLQKIKYALKHGIGFIQYLIIPKPYHSVTLFFE